jgi:hypothetical protein
MENTVIVNSHIHKINNAIESNKDQNVCEKIKGDQQKEGLCPVELNIKICALV